MDDVNYRHLLQMQQNTLSQQQANAVSQQQAYYYQAGLLANKHYNVVYPSLISDGPAIRPIDGKNLGDLFIEDTGKILKFLVLFSPVLSLGLLWMI